MTPNTPPCHTPVLLQEVLTALEPARGGWFVDGTVGLGGHSEALLAAGANVLAIDRDAEALRYAAERLAKYGDRVRFVHDDFRSLKKILSRLGWTQVAGVLVDLGVSSWQLDNPARGFSFRSDGPLDMRMDTTSRSLTAADIVNTWEEAKLAELIWRWGEERCARRVARDIVAARRQSPILTTGRLADIVRRAIPTRGPYRLDPATRTFQALRIAVNRELEGLETFISEATDVLAPGGRLAVLTFHSLEDRLIKRALRREAGVPDDDAPVDVWGQRIAPEPRLRLLHRRPIVPTAAEVAANPRARSAKLRSAERLPPASV
ncbi:MAG: 16S rRNA (cytosine(1402)-N(4))-methyltransferase RsmH [Chloracidobacterium sp.]|nr:16S rRNA (cytosine(1402)-N(4))-methyltransferase RsmH [Chloracidobacterium sp.]MDW8216305.1 16S rRNA (cytosine(1402)-N(4))-methyltransferase RsmH [Acidobacteriota bacterium]